jgi:hypothetical protein
MGRTGHPTPTSPDGTGTFTKWSTDQVDANGLVNIGAVTYTGAAPACIININDILLVNGVGVSNNSAGTQIFNVFSSPVFLNGSSANAGRPGHLQQLWRHLVERDQHGGQV